MLSVVDGVLSRVIRGFPLPIVLVRLLVGGSGLVSRSSSDRDFSGECFDLSCFLANLPSGPLGPVPLFVGSCSNVLIGLLINLRWIIFLSEVVTVCFVPVTAVCRCSEYGLSNFPF